MLSVVAKVRYINHRPVARWKNPSARSPGLLGDRTDCSAGAKRAAGAKRVAVPTAPLVRTAPLVPSASPVFPFVSAVCSGEDGRGLAPMRKLAKNSLT